MIFWWLAVGLLGLYLLRGFFIRGAQAETIDPLPTDTVFVSAVIGYGGLLLIGSTLYGKEGLLIAVGLSVLIGAAVYVLGWIFGKCFPAAVGDPLGE